MLIFACPSWSLILRADTFASSRKLATVLRSVRLTKPVMASSSRTSRQTWRALDGSCRQPLGESGHRLDVLTDRSPAVSEHAHGRAGLT